MHSFVGALNDHATFHVIATQKTRGLSLPFLLLFLRLAEIIQRRNLLSLSAEISERLGLLNIELAGSMAAFPHVAGEDVLFGREDVFWDFGAGIRLRKHDAFGKIVTGTSAVAVRGHGHGQSSVIVAPILKVGLIAVIKGEIGVAGGVLGRKERYGSIQGFRLSLSERLELVGSVGHLVLHLRD